MATGFIIQARLGSTRLPKKIVRPFYNDKNILELLLSNLKEKYTAEKIVVATTSKDIDNPIEELALSLGLACYRGSENNVLNRFIEAADNFNIDVVLRVCSDNPFLDVESFQELIYMHQKYSFDYVGFSVKGTPSVKTHFGFWGELAKVSALKKAALLTQESIYQEHVTNFIYANPNHFSLGWVKVDDVIANRNDIRLTVDTEEDFKALSELYLSLLNNKVPNDPKSIIAFIDKDPELKEKMVKEIYRNTK